MPTGYCTLDDLRRALRKAELPGDISQDNEIAIDAIAAQTEWLEKEVKRHWYVPGGIGEDTKGLVPTSTETRDDEEDIPTPAAVAVGGPIEPRTWQGDYARIELARRDAKAISELLVRDADGYTDWVASDQYAGGTWPDAVGEDYYLRVNNGGWSHLYLDVTNLYDNEDDEYVINDFVNAVYVTFEYGHEGIPRTVRRAVAFRAASDFVEEAAVQIPANAEVYNVESLAEKFERKSEELLSVYMEGE